MKILIKRISLVKPTIFIILFLIGSLNSYAQDNTSELKIVRKALYSHLENFERNTKRSDYSLITLIKISVNKTGKVSQITYSNNLDSTDFQSFKTEFDKININLLEAYFKKEKIKSIEVLIPFSIYIMENDLAKIYRANFFDFGKFNDFAFSGRVFWMEPIALHVIIDH